MREEITLLARIPDALTVEIVGPADNYPFLNRISVEPRIIREMAQAWLSVDTLNKLQIKLPSNPPDAAWRVVTPDGTAYKIPDEMIVPKGDE